MKIKKIILGLDNLENVELGIGDVGAFYLDNIHEIIGGFTLSYIGKCKQADYLHIQIHKRVDEIQRLHDYKDITNVKIEYEDGSVEDIYVPYKQEGDFLGLDNLYQTSFISKQGYLHIVISKDKTVEEVFNEEFEDDEGVEFSFNMYGI
ncbi:hypothetical protein QES_0279 [Clostridioides difficile CD149]|uniref:hypothetical protein n=5 Tax=Clostridioides difficile TaxID=1496 RepID=UPI00016C6283|nr:hypothetical protein [Clostridioides difficile]EGT3659694.1 hypothetical protein [Clostridioides difficile]EGT3961280.1 hypothetical protein [Clostridioides difficile]EGT4016547.1 hypothetical protein [Clostridioides difficile]EGT4183899.1 hypothetical protein [Clostridioides difficile]EGT4203179.1 hypothetical protein [Clostridioides difficile]